MDCVTLSVNFIHDRYQTLAYQEICKIKTTMLLVYNIATCTHACTHVHRKHTRPPPHNILHTHTPILTHTQPNYYVLHMHVHTYAHMHTHTCMQASWVNPQADIQWAKSFPTLQQPGNVLLEWSEEERAKYSESIRTIGTSLHRGESLHSDLQRMYQTNYNLSYAD